MTARHRCGSHSSEREQLDMFRALPGDLAPRDAQDLMAYPFFSLAKSKPHDADRFQRGHDRHSRRSRAGARHGDHLGCRRADMGGQPDRRGPRRRFEDVAPDGRNTLRNPHLCRPRHKRARLSSSQGRARPAAIDDRHDLDPPADRAPTASLLLDQRMEGDGPIRMAGRSGWN